MKNLIPTWIHLLSENVGAFQLLKAKGKRTEGGLMISSNQGLLVSITYDGVPKVVAFLFQQ